MTIPRPRFISRFEALSCWDRLEPGKRRGNLEVNPCLSASDVRCQCDFCCSSVPFVRSHHILLQQMWVLPVQNWFREFSFLMLHGWWSERDRWSLSSPCPLLSAILIQGGETGTCQMRTFAQLKRKSGKWLCLRSDSEVHYQFNAWSGKRSIFQLHHWREPRELYVSGC